MSDEALQLELIDMNDLMERFGGERDFIDELLGDYFRESAENMETLESAVASGDADKVRLVGHSLKGISGNMGFAAVQAEFLKMETAGRENRLDDARSLLPDLQALFARLREDYRKITGA